MSKGLMCKSGFPHVSDMPGGHHANRCLTILVDQRGDGLMYAWGGILNTVLSLF